ncbi:MAG: hypothetical protein JWP97_3561 [Labilithrix sp.]|nr:hypothetical protein [Labilithrix sp.]
MSPREWTDLCEAQAERARRCPGPAPEPTATCADSAACVGQLVRPEVIRALARCQNQNDCTRACSIDRVTASLPPAPANTELEQACAMRRIVCPALDCNALARPVRPLEPATIEPLTDCLKFEKSCLDVAACYLEKLTPIVAQFNACGFGDEPARDGGATADASSPDAAPAR